MSRDTILFDINETVLDLSSLKPAFETVFDDSGVASRWFLMLLHTSTVCTLTGVGTTFANLAGIMLDATAARMNQQISDASRRELLGSFANLKPRPDIEPSLKQLRFAGYRVVALTNSSLTLVTTQIANAGLNKYFDQIVSVEETGSFKPDPRVYRFAAQRLQRPIDELRLVATHDWDTHGALSSGMLGAYIDRSGLPYHPLYRRPDVYSSNMGDVVEQVISKDSRIPRD